MTTLELSVEELDLQEAELLPERETLGYYSHPCCYNWANVYATNVAIAYGKGDAYANQFIVVDQGG